MKNKIREMIRQNISILIIDDHPMIRDGIQTMLISKSNNADYIIDEASIPDEALMKIRSNTYDIILMDYSLPGITGAQLTKLMLLEKPALRVLGISGHAEYSCIKEMSDAGALGYLLKNIGPTELTQAITCILNGGQYYNREIIPQLLASLKNENTVPLLQKGKNHSRETGIKYIAKKRKYLTGREKQIVRLLAKNKSYAEIAQKLKISKRTVESNRYNMLNKLNVKNTASLVKHSVELGLI